MAPETAADLSLEEINEILHQHLKTDFEFLSIQNLDSSHISKGLLSSQDRWTIKYGTKKGEGNLNIFIKRIPSEGYHKDLIESMGIFDKELQCYETILSEFQNYTDGLRLPKFYYARSNRLIVLGDLISEGFQSKIQSDPWDLDHCEVTLATLAKFHGSSFAIEANNGVKLTEMYPDILKAHFVEHHGVKIWNRAGIKTSEKLIEKYLNNRYSEEHIKNVYEFVMKLPEKYQKSSIYPNVLIHFDLKGNNIMYRYDEAGKPMEACFVDFQLYRYSMPAYDILYFLYATTTLNFRKKHLDRLLQFYYEHLSKALQKRNINIEKILPRPLYDTMIREELPAVLARVTLNMSYAFLPGSAVEEIMKNDEEFKAWNGGDRFPIVEKEINKNPEYKKRFLSTITELYDHFCKN